MVPFEPQAMIPPASDASRTTMPSSACHLRRRAGMPNSSKQAKAAPPVAYQGVPGRFGWLSMALVLETVETVIVVVTELVPGIFTEPLARVIEGRFLAPAGLDVTAAERVTVPVNPARGARVMVDVPPEPAVRINGVPEMVNAGFAEFNVFDHAETRFGRGALPSATFQ